MFLGCRPYVRSFYNTGRETFLLPVTWKDGWPQILEQGKPVPTVVNKKDLKPETSSPLTGNISFIDRFDTPSLHHRWIFLRNPDMKWFTWGKAGGLVIRPSANDISQVKPLSSLFCRQQHTCFTAETEVAFSPESRKQLAGMALLQNEQYNFVFGKTRLDGKTAVVLKRTEQTAVTIASVFIEEQKPLRLKIAGDGRYYSFYYAIDGDNWQTLATGVDAVNLSTDRSGGFIGTCIGLYATTNNQ